MNEKKETRLKKITLTGVFVGVAVVGSMLSIPVMGAKCSPVQHIINILSGIILGPYYAVTAAFLASFIRNILGLGTLLAFPGSMCGAFLAGIIFRLTKREYGACLGELVGTSIIGGMLSYPIALFLMGNKEVVLFGFVFPFFVSSLGGTIIAMIVLASMKKMGVIKKLRKELQ